MNTGTPNRITDVNTFPCNLAMVAHAQTQ